MVWDRFIFLLRNTNEEFRVRMLIQVARFVCLGALLFNAVLGYSGGMGPTDERFDIYVPNLESSNEYSGGAFFLRPSGAADYNVYTSPLNPDVTTPLFSPSWDAQDIALNFTPGFFFNFRHIFKNSGSDANLYWAHLRTSNSTTNLAAPARFNGPYYQVGPEASAIHTASGQVRDAYDLVTLEVAKHVNIDPALTTRLLAGISGVWISEQMRTTFSGVPAFTITTADISKFNGAGLRLGLDAAYLATSNLDIVGLFASSLFLGTERPSVLFTGMSDVLQLGGIPVNYQHISHDHFLQLVPAVDGKLGIKYHRFFEANYTVSFEAGYMGTFYFNALQKYEPANYADNSPGIDTGAIYLKSLSKLSLDFGVTGPYIMASLRA